jgi:hypothetical protein
MSSSNMREVVAQQLRELERCRELLLGARHWPAAVFALTSQRSHDGNRKHGAKPASAAHAGERSLRHTHIRSSGKLGCLPTRVYVPLVNTIKPACLFAL